MEIKVNDISPGMKPEGTPQAAPKDDTFKFTLISKISETDLQVRLSGMMADIVNQGDRLKKHMDIRDMRRYRSLVKGFLNEVVNRSHAFSRENFLDKRGRHRVYGIIRLIDANMDELAEQLIADEKDGLKILAKIDEIRGLLLDIFL